MLDFARRFELIRKEQAQKLSLTEVDFSDEDDIAASIPRYLSASSAYLKIDTAHGQVGPLQDHLISEEPLMCVHSHLGLHRRGAKVVIALGDTAGQQRIDAKVSTPPALLLV